MIRYALHVSSIEQMSFSHPGEPFALIRQRSGDPFPARGLPAIHTWAAYSNLAKLAGLR